MRLPYKSGTVRISSPYGNRMLNGAREWHNGVDLVGSDKTIVAVCGGVVRSSTIYYKGQCSDDTWQWGNYVRIDGFDGNRYFYCHMDTRLVQVGRVVQEGDVLGIEGNTGYSFGSHLHFEVRNNRNVSIDPTPFIGLKNAVGQIVEVSKPDYATMVCRKCGLEPHTKAYLNGWKWAEDLWRKLWEAMQ